MNSSPCTDKPCSFFKIILSHIGRHSELMIPRKFVSQNGKNLHDRIFLKASGGSVWPVDLERCNGDVWLKHGWPEFAEFYSIRFGHLLVFQYQGCSTLDVVIFDTSATEINYPLTCTGINSSGESTKSRKRVIEVDDYDLRPCKTTKAISDCGKASGRGVNSIREIKQEKAKADGVRASELGKTGAVASAEAFKSNNPFFTINVSPSHLDGRHGVYVKKSFQESYIMWKNSDQVILKVAGSTWFVESKFNNNKCILTDGWDKFARDNSLKVGDACVFELINPLQRLLQVFIFPAAKDPNIKEEKTRMRITSEAKKPRVHTSAKTSQSEIPFFTVKMQPSYLSRPSVLYVPRQFIHRYISKDKCNVSLQVSDGRAWPVRCSNVKFSVGWRTFAEANNLAVGDVCVFQLINNKEKSLNVVIHRN